MVQYCLALPLWQLVPDVTGSVVFIRLISSLQLMDFTRAVLLIGRPHTAAALNTSGLFTNLMKHTCNASCQPPEHNAADQRVSHTAYDFNMTVAYITGIGSALLMGN